MKFTDHDRWLLAQITSLQGYPNNHNAPETPASGAKYGPKWNEQSESESGIVSQQPQGNSPFDGTSTEGRGAPMAGPQPGDSLNTLLNGLPGFSPQSPRQSTSRRSARRSGPVSRRIANSLWTVVWLLLTGLLVEIGVWVLILVGHWLYR